MKIGQFILALCLIIPGVWVLLAPPIQTDPVPPGSVIVEYWEKWTGVEGDQMREIVNDYNRTVGKDKGIYVRYISMSNIDRKTLISTAGGAPPDIAGLWENQLVQYAMLDALHPLDELAREYGIVEKDYKRVYWDMCNYDGKLWALVSSPAAAVLQYNRKVFWENAATLRAAGLDPTRAPETIDELDRYAKALDVIQGDNLIRTGYLPAEPGWFINFTGIWFGTEMLDPKNNRWLFDTPEMIRAFKWLHSYYKRLGTNAVTNFRSGFGNYTSAQNPFLIGKVAMIQQGPWIAIYLEQYRPDMNRLIVPKNLEVFLPQNMRNCNYAWASAPFPSAVPGMKDVAHCGFDVFVIPKAARHKKEAFDFMHYCQQPEVVEKLQKMHCCNSQLKTVSKEFLRYHPNPYIDVFEQVSSSPNAHHDVQSPIRSEVFAALTAVVERISLLKVDNVPDAMRELQEIATKKNKRYEEQMRIRKEAMKN